MAQNHSHSSRRQAVAASESVSQERYTRLKRKVQEIKTENVRVNTELERARKRIRTLKRQKELLLDRISQYEDTDSSDSEKSVNVSSMESSDSEELSSAANSRASSVPSVRNSKKGGRPRTAGKKLAAPAPANNIVNSVPITHTPAAKPAPVKRASKRPLNTKTMKVQHVEKDEHGLYILPVQIGILTVLNLGTVVYDRESFHNERYIWPVGYAVKRAYNSMINPELQTTYTCKIEDGGDGPKFVIEAEDQPNKPIVANTATGAWTTVVREANAIRHRDHSNSASGPDYFGFSQATIRKMIQDLPNASKCKNYTMQSFEVMKTRNNGGRRRANGAKANGKSAVNGAASGPAVPVQTPVQESGERSSSNGSANGDLIISDAVEGDSDEE